MMSQSTEIKYLPLMLLLI